MNDPKTEHPLGGPQSETADEAAPPADRPGFDKSGPEAAPDDASADLQLGLIASLKAEVADLKDRLLRSHAEMDNVRKRTEREKADAHKYAVTKFARDIVTVGDNFQRAIDSVPAGAADEHTVLKSFLDGVTMTERELMNALERHGIRRLDPKGEMFDPHHHQAVMETENSEVAAGTVLQVFQSGYMIEDRILRPAMVVVAKGGTKQGKPGDGLGSSPAQAQGTSPHLPNDAA